MARFSHVLLSCGALILLAAQPVTQAQTASGIPAYFFNEWSVSSDCSEQHAGPNGHVGDGLLYRVSASSVSADGQSYAFEAINQGNKVWPGDWPELRLEYRAGSKMGAVPADFECVPGQEESSPFLAMSGYSISAEPWYEYEHWYGLVNIHGEPHHVLIFPRNAAGPASALIVLHDADAGDNVQLDTDGIIHSRNR